jgi:hypothetical protein
MAGPIFLICQGRSGGTIVAHALAEALSAPLLLEPFHDDLRDWVKKQPKRTPAHLRHDGVTNPYRGYEGLDLTHQATLASPPGRKLVWLDYLVHQAGGRPVVKVLRMWGHMARLREEFPDATILHLHRDPGAQWRSYKGLGFPRDYFGEYRHGYKFTGYSDLSDLSDEGFHWAVWALALEEGKSVADLSVSLSDVTTFARFFTRHD